MVQKFQIKIDINGSVAILGMQGDVTHECENNMLNAYDKISTAKVKHILFDFSQVDYINSAGMSVIIMLLTKSQEVDQQLHACGLSSHFQKIFGMVGLLKYIPHYETREEALKAIA